MVRADLERDVVIVQGDDAATFLHSQLANDIASVPVGGSVHSLILEPTGHIQSLVRVVRHVDTVFTLDVERGHGEDVQARLSRFILRAKVAMRASDWVVRGFRGSGVGSSLSNVNGRAVVAWGDADAIDVVGEASALPTIGEETEPEHLDVMRVDMRWPRLGVDVLVGDIPATSGVLSVAASFTKGCYPGQELVERMDSRGTEPPVIIRVLPRDGLHVGARVISEGVDVGTVTSVGRSLALARVGRGSAVGEPLR